jgi:hypothetical protein
MVFSTWSERQLRDAKTEKLLEAMFSTWSVPRLYKEEQLRLREPFGTPVTIVGWCEIADSLVGSGVSQLLDELVGFSCELLLLEAGS